MNQAKLKRTDRTSAEYVVLHAHLRKKRGLRPSLSFGEERNPQKALEIARSICRQKFEQSLERAILGVEMENDRTNWKKQHKRAMGKENAYCEDCGKHVSEWLPGEECVPRSAGTPPATGSEQEKKRQELLLSLREFLAKRHPWEVIRRMEENR